MIAAKTTGNARGGTNGSPFRPESIVALLGAGADQYLLRVGATSWRHATGLHGLISRGGGMHSRKLPSAETRGGDGWIAVIHGDR
jgi:hypothetical protein